MKESKVELLFEFQPFFSFDCSDLEFGSLSLRVGLDVTTELLILSSEFLLSLMNVGSTICTLNVCFLTTKMSNAACKEK